MRHTYEIEGGPGCECSPGRTGAWRYVADRNLSTWTVTVICRLCSAAERFSFAWDGHLFGPEISLRHVEHRIERALRAMYQRAEAVHLGFGLAGGESLRKAS